MEYELKLKVGKERMKNLDVGEDEGEGGREGGDLGGVESIVAMFDSSV